MGGGGSTAKSKSSQNVEKNEPTPTKPSAPAAEAINGKPAAKPVQQADGQGSASAVVGGAWTRPEGPSPDDDQVLEDWQRAGKLFVLRGVWCCVPYKIIAVLAEAATDQAFAQKKALAVVDEVAQVAQRTFSHFESDSEVSKINRLRSDEVHQPSGAMQQVLEMAATVNQMTRGAFDPAVLPAARFYKERAKNRDFSGAADVVAYSTWKSFTLTNEGLRKAHAQAQLDLCGLAKGWAIDEMVTRLQEAGFVSCFVDWGGDIKVSGQHPAGRNWTVAIREPPDLESVQRCEANSECEGDAEHPVLAHVELRDGQAVATSGDYLQLLGNGLSHVLDPKVGAPVQIGAETCASASVVARSCMLADALATAAMAVGNVKVGRQLLDGFQGSRLKDPVTDYLLYSRLGPRVVRLQHGSLEVPAHRKDRLQRHEPAHVVVVGGGLAGVSAALEARKARAKVTLLEKEAELGGNSAKATSGINACDTRVQREQGIDDDGRFFERDTHVSGNGGSSSLACVTMLSEKSAAAIHWLMDELGVPLTALSQLGGHSRKRTHRVPPRPDGTPVPVGYTIMQHARAAVTAIEGIDVKTSCEVRRLLSTKSEDGIIEVSGLAYVDLASKEEHEIRCDAVVLTTGGFGFDQTTNGLMHEYRPDLVGVPTTNGSFATGEGIRFGADIGANLVDMDKVQLHPTAFIDPKDPTKHTKYLGPEALRGSGGILLDQKGCRFVNELDLRSTVSQKILEHCEAYKLSDGTVYRPWAWCVLGEEAQEKFGKPMLSFYKDKVGLFEAAEDVGGLAELIGCPETALVETLREYASAFDNKICMKTGKVVFPSRICETDRHFIVARITPCIHYCMGGLEIGPTGEVLTTAEKGAIGRRAKVRRLFAAGECTGGVHGGNRLGGNSLLECVVFGRLAGERAATIRQTQDSLLAGGEWVPLQLAEVRSTDAKYGQSTAVYRFMLHGSLQHTGLEVGRFIAIRGERDGDTLTGYYSPISRPDDTGIIDILCRTDDKGGPIVEFLRSLRPGGSCQMKGMGGLKLNGLGCGDMQCSSNDDVSPKKRSKSMWNFEGREIRRFSLLCGGTGLAPAVQVARAYLRSLTSGQLGPVGGADGGLRILYAAETTADLAFITAFDNMRAAHPNAISYYLVLNKPPAGWTQGVGFVDPDMIRQKLWYPPADDHLIIMCGPPVFEKIMCGTLAKLGYPREQYYSFAADPAANG